jgi:hypothetical protein
MPNEPVPPEVPPPPPDVNAPDPSWPNPAYDINYQSAHPQANTIQMVKLAYIFNFVMSGLDGLFGLLLGAAAIALPIFLQRIAAMPPGAGGAAAAGPPPPPLLFGLFYGAEAFVSIAVAVVKLIAAFKLMRRGRHAWVMSGFESIGDPAVHDEVEVTGVRVLDPLYPHGSGKWGPSPRPNALVSPATLAKQFVIRDHGRVDLGVPPGYLLVLPTA